MKKKVLLKKKFKDKNENYVKCFNTVSDLNNIIFHNRSKKIKKYLVKLKASAQSMNVYKYLFYEYFNNMDRFSNT